MKNSDKTRSLSECDREFEIRDFSTSQRGGVLLQTAILLLSVKSTKIQSTSKKRNGNESILFDFSLFDILQPNLDAGIFVQFAYYFLKKSVRFVKARLKYG